MKISGGIMESVIFHGDQQFKDTISRWSARLQVRCIGTRWKVSIVGGKQSGGWGRVSCSAAALAPDVTSKSRIAVCRASRGTCMFLRPLHQTAHKSCFFPCLAKALSYSIFILYYFSLSRFLAKESSPVLLA